MASCLQTFLFCFQFKAFHLNTKNYITTYSYYQYFVLSITFAVSLRDQKNAIIIHVTRVQESPGHAARVVVDQGDIHLTRVTLQKLKAWNNWNMEVMLQCWCLGIIYGQMLTYQLSKLFLVQTLSVIDVHLIISDSTNLLQQNLLMSLRCEHLNKQTLQKRGWISIQKLARHALHARLTYGFTSLPVCPGTSLSCVSTFCWMYW